MNSDENKYIRIFVLHYIDSLERDYKYAYNFDKLKEERYYMGYVDLLLHLSSNGHDNFIRLLNCYDDFNRSYTKDPLFKSFISEVFIKSYNKIKNAKTNMSASVMHYVRYSEDSRLLSDLNLDLNKELIKNLMNSIESDLDSILFVASRFNKTHYLTNTVKGKERLKYIIEYVFDCFNNDIDKVKKKLFSSEMKDEMDSNILLLLKEIVERYDS